RSLFLFFYFALVCVAKTMMPSRRSASTDRSKTPGLSEGNGGYRSSSSLSSSSALALQPPPNPYQRILQRLEGEEKKLRKQLASVSMHPNVLIKFCASCIDVSAALLAEVHTSSPHHSHVSSGGGGADSRRNTTLSAYANNALSTAHLIACRVEGLLRHGTHDRRRYNSEDFLNLCRDFVYEAPKEQHALVELSRRKVLSRTFQLIARICAASGHHAEQPTPIMRFPPPT
ncbi:Hypothetical protein, putative, partial [Bodo saltans]